MKKAKTRMCQFCKKKRSIDKFYKTYQSKCKRCITTEAKIKRDIEKGKKERAEIYNNHKLKKVLKTTYDKLMSFCENTEEEKIPLERYLIHFGYQYIKMQYGLDKKYCILDIRAKENKLVQADMLEYMLDRYEGCVIFTDIINKKIYKDEINNGLDLLRFFYKINNNIKMDIFYSNYNSSFLGDLENA